MSTALSALQSRFEIMELTARYNEAWDDGRVEEWIATFTPDGEFIMKGVPETKGPAALRAMIEAMIPVDLATPRDQLATKAEHRFAELRAEVYRMIKKPVAGPGAPVAVDQANGH